MENGRNLQNAAGSVANLDGKMLVNGVFHDRITRGIDKRAERHIVRCFGVRKFNAIRVARKDARRPEVEKVLSHDAQPYFGVCKPDELTHSSR